MHSFSQDFSFDNHYTGNSLGPICSSLVSYYELDWVDSYYKQKHNSYICEIYGLRIYTVSDNVVL